MDKVRRGSLKRNLVVGLCVVAVVWVVGCGIIYSEMRKPPEQFGRFMMKVPGPVAFLVFPFETLWTRARAGTLQVGDVAPDFSLTTIDKSGSVRLSTLTREEPVVLVFGSYT